MIRSNGFPFGAKRKYVLGLAANPYRQLCAIPLGVDGEIQRRPQEIFVRWDGESRITRKGPRAEHPCIMSDMTALGYFWTCDVEIIDARPHDYHDALARIIDAPTSVWTTLPSGRPGDPRGLSLDEARAWLADHPSRSLPA